MARQQKKRIDKKLDKVIFVPVNDLYIKEGLVEAKHRINMLKLATKSFHNLEVDDIEIKENRKLYAVDAFELIAKSKFLKNNNDKIFFIMGSDNFKNMPKWKNYETIKDKYNYLIIERNENDITSTRIRNMILKNEKEVKQYLNKDVYEYIINNGLYKIK